MPSVDPLLDSVDYDPVGHLNAIFSHHSTLSSLEQTSSTLLQLQHGLDRQIEQSISTQIASDGDNISRIQNTKAELAGLFTKIDNVRSQAAQTEQSIAEMTADIKRLDGAKRNLTLSMTVLKRLQMLTTAYEQLQTLSKTRQYRECAQLLQAVLQLAAHFKGYRSIDQIATLSRNVSDLQRELLENICEDFEVIFAKGEVAQKKGLLAEACLVMDAIGEHARSRLVTWYCNTQLREYRQIFRGNDEAGSLDNISRRYSWFNRMLKTYDHEHAAIFPAHWKVGETLAQAFSEGTRDDFKDILQRLARRSEGQSIDVNLLLSCMQETLNFEHTLERRFATNPRMSVDTATSADDRSHGIGQVISEAFEPYMSLWVESQDQQLATLVADYRRQAPRNPDEEFSPQQVIPSSTELFHFYRLALTQCAKLSTGSRLLELSRTFAKYLDTYAQQVLFYYLSERWGPQGPSLEDSILILNTADYCYITSNQLEEKIKARIDEEFRPEVDLQSQADAFMGVASAAIRVLIRKVEVECEPIWKEMRQTPWGKLETVGDQSTFMTELLRKMKTIVGDILKYLPKQQYARAFCDNVVDQTVNTFVLNIVQCRPISETGAEQMLLDSYALKTGFGEIAELAGPSGGPPPAAFMKRVNSSLSKLDGLLKTIQVRPSPPEALVQAYLLHIADRSEPNFRRLLDLKGIRRQDYTALLDLFNAHCQGPQNESLQASSQFMAGLPMAAAPAQSGNPLTSLKDSGGIGTPNLSGSRFDPAVFGSALISAAREGVDRFGGPALGSMPGGSKGSGTTSPPPPPPPQHAATSFDSPTASQTATNLNENLRNIGKFFKRDLGAIGRFGRTTDGDGIERR
ncbi:hypothetical protein P152DRAFT_449644 [Eremomyces bilateralis CBS 781.70]|uniref:Vps53 N-terminal domain-containing protein n=1 Tax=Eremomyces bilateralis CBS 781.70 TaxID=1392243 RepID=A0A6G1G2R1_9PEZI|nr:uncharacterized protein P152DRAFT_449644 [Eremomyces bilateralis CBS 781.70]KAF1812395.1 hypothetical protein P152DRAFT_449644 [Eremomyces bilateralis CBS 781.70]